MMFKMLMLMKMKQQQMIGYVFIISLVVLVSGLVAAIDLRRSADDLEVIDPEVLAAIQAEEDGAVTREQILEKLVSVLQAVQRNQRLAGRTAAAASANAIDYDYGALGLSKRQIRYHQCYFNPISCFRRRK